MGWRYRKYLTFIPGIKINLSKSGVSYTFGKRGLSVNVGQSGSYLNTNIPGTGFYSRQKISNKKRNKTYVTSNYDTPKNDLEEFFMPSNTWGCVFRWLGMISIVVLLVNLIKYVFGQFDNSEDNTSNLIIWGVIAILFLITYSPLILSFFLKKSNQFSAEDIKELISVEKDEVKKTFLYGLEKKYSSKKSNEVICLNDKLTEKQTETYKRICSTFTSVCTSDRIWIAISKSNNVDRKIVEFISDNFNDVKCKITDTVPILSDGVFDYYIYPKFIVKAKDEANFDIIPLEKINLKWSLLTITEKERPSALPLDAKIIRYTYEKTNNDGTPDLRFTNNKKLPIYQYAKIKIDNLEISFIISNIDKARAFADAIVKHKASLLY